jgi:hypothetical protein
MNDINNACASVFELMHQLRTILVMIAMITIEAAGDLLLVVAIAGFVMFIAGQALIEIDRHIGNFSCIDSDLHCRSLKRLARSLCLRSRSGRDESRKRKCSITDSPSG